MPLSEASLRLCEEHTMHYIRRVCIPTSASWWAGLRFRGQHIRQIELETELGCQLATTNYYVRERERIFGRWTIKGTLGTHPSCLPTRQKPQYAGGGGRREAREAHHTWRSMKHHREAKQQDRKKRTGCMRHSIFVLRQKKISTLPRCIASEGAKPCQQTPVGGWAGDA